MLAIRDDLCFEDPDELVRACRARPELAAAFGSEERCRDWLARMRWPRGFRCSMCGGDGRWDSERGGYHCRYRRCRRFTSVTAGTVLHGTRKPLTKWFEALLLVCQRGVNARMLQRAIGLTYKAAWTWGHKLRALLTSFVVPEDLRPPREKKHHSFDAERARGGPRPRRPDPCAPGPCGCTKLTKRDFRWFEEREEERAADRAELRRSLGDPESRILPPIPREKWSEKSYGVDLAHHELLATYWGSVSERHLRAYLDELGFRMNRRWRSPREALEVVAREVAHSEPRPYRAIVARPSPAGRELSIF